MLVCHGQLPDELRDVIGNNYYLAPGGQEFNGGELSLQPDEIHGHAMAGLALVGPQYFGYNEEYVFFGGTVKLKTA